MAKKTVNKKVTAVIPTYNEAQRIGRVLDVLVSYPNFTEIIVVDDGSTDNTSEIINKYQVNFIKNPINRGKGYAMDLGVKKSTGDILFFVDADVVGLTHKIIDQIIQPVINDEVEMFIGMRNRKIYLLHSFILFVPLLGGERALTKKLWFMLPEYYKQRFRVEAGLNFYATYYGNGFKYKIFKGLSQVIKEKKYGLLKGFKQRIGMMYNIFTAQLKLQFVDITKTQKNQRLLALLLIQSFLGILLGAIILIVIYLGPSYLLNFFTEEIKTGVITPLIRSILLATNPTTLNILWLVGTLSIFANFIVFMLALRRINPPFVTLVNKLNNEKIKG